MAEILEQELWGLCLSVHMCLHVYYRWISKSVSVSRSVVPNSSQPHGLQSTRLLCPWDSPSKDTGVGCHFLLQGILPTQGLNPGFSPCRRILYCLSYQGSPRMLEWIALMWQERRVRSLVRMSPHCSTGLNKILASSCLCYLVFWFTTWRQSVTLCLRIFTLYHLPSWPVE